MRRASEATLIGLVLHYAVCYGTGTPLWTEAIAEWIMARTPSHLAVPLLERFGDWAKPFAMTGGLAALGFAVLLVSLAPRGLWWRVAAAVAAAAAFGTFFSYQSWLGQISFWAAALAWLQSGVLPTEREAPVPAGLGPTRRQALAMAGGVAAVALESYARNEVAARRAVPSTPLSPFPPAVERASFARGLVRPAVTPTSQFYGMSKNTVDPSIDPKQWRLRITLDGRLLRSVSYQELLSLPRMERFVTLRCISNTLQSDLMGTAHWSGVRFSQLWPRAQVPDRVTELAILGVDGHGDSVPLEYAFSDELFFALGMNGETLNRVHGFPLRLLAPRYYGFKSVKWIGELRLSTEPYIGTWPRLGYTKEPLIHTASHIDRYVRDSGRVRVGGVSFAGNRGIRLVRVRADSGAWVGAAVEPALSPWTLSRWYAEVAAEAAQRLEAQALDGAGRWQSSRETPLFPNGVDGPTIRSVSS